MTCHAWQECRQQALDRALQKIAVRNNAAVQKLSASAVLRKFHDKGSETA
jgi:hypothetical protein